jgi:hypothetical protein
MDKLKLKHIKIQHFKRRLMERFGITITPDQYTNLVNEILDFINRPVIIEETGNSFHKVELSNHTFFVYFDWEYECIVTAYRQNWLIELDNGNYILKNKKVLRKHIRRRDQILSNDANKLIK